MKSPTMVYKSPGAHKLHDVMVDYKVVDGDDKGAMDSAISDGWCMSPATAKILADQTKKTQK